MDAWRLYNKHMYFSSRLEAGYKLAQELLVGYRYENTIVVALSDGGVQVGQQLAAALHTPITLMLTEDIQVPGEGQLFGTVNQSGRFTYNGMFSAGEVEAYYSEFHGYLEDQKREKMGKINQLLGAGGIVDEAILREHNVILVSDGLSSGGSLDAAADFLKPLNIQKLIIAAPIASVEAVDRAHIVGDELHILAVTDNYLDTDHYYDVNDIPSHEATIAALNEVVLNWH
jgi:putative phosphoribosyl transferase